MKVYYEIRSLKQTFLWSLVQSLCIIFPLCLLQESCACVPVCASPCHLPRLFSFVLCDYAEWPSVHPWPGAWLFPPLCRYGLCVWLVVWLFVVFSFFLIIWFLFQGEIYFFYHLLVLSISVKLFHSMEKIQIMKWFLVTMWTGELTTFQRAFLLKKMYTFFTFVFYNPEVLADDGITLWLKINTLASTFPLSNELLTFLDCLQLWMKKKRLK